MDDRIRHALLHLLGFDPITARIIEQPGYAPYVLPSWVDPVRHRFYGMEGEFFLSDEELPDVVFMPDVASATRSRALTIAPGRRKVWPGAPTTQPDGFAPRLQWYELQKLRQQIRDLFPRTLAQDPVRTLVNKLDEIAHEILVTVVVPRGDDETLWRKRELPTDLGRLLSVVHGYRQMQEDAREALTEKSNVGEGSSASQGGPGRPRGTSLIIATCREFLPDVTAREMAMIVALERGHMVELAGDLHLYFENPSAAQQAWSKILPRNREVTSSQCREGARRP